MPPPANLQVLALTFVSAVDGWALGSGPCSCVSVYRTADGGATWIRTGAPSVPPSCFDGPSQPCLDRIVFSSVDRGFVFGSSWGPVYGTSDGGAHWALLAVSGVSAIALAGQTAIRLRQPSGGCTTGVCRLERSANGGLTWTGTGLPTLQPEGLDGDVLLQGDGHAYAVAYGNPAGGGSELAVIYRSSNSGATWTKSDDPCSNEAPYGGPITLGVSSTAAGVVADVCLDRLNNREFVIVSSDGGAHFGPRRAAPATAFGNVFAAGSASVLAAATSDGLMVTRDGGRTWRTTYSCPAESNGTFRVHFVGFETASVAHLICGSVVARSTDGGLTWANYRF